MESRFQCPNCGWTSDSAELHAYCPECGERTETVRKSSSQNSEETKDGGTIDDTADDEVSDKVEELRKLREQAKIKDKAEKSQYGVYE